MAFFGKKKEEKASSADDTKRKDKKVGELPVKDEKKDLKGKSVFSMKNPKDLPHKILTEPMITEKSHELLTLNKYVFMVSKGSSKKQVKKSIEDLYEVTVERVGIINISPKRRNYGRVSGWKSGYKKAIVTLKEGDKIELFEGV